MLDAYAAARKAVPEARDPRLRIEHAQVVRKEDVARFAELGVIASMQPSHASDDMRWADARLGPGRVDGAYAWRWFADAGVAAGLRQRLSRSRSSTRSGASTRRHPPGRRTASRPGGWHPEQRLTLEEALRGFTAGSAYRGLRRRPPRHAQAGIARRPDDRRPRPVPRRSRANLLATRGR